MREILFKAKRKDNGEWVEGLIWKKKYNSNKIFISCFPDEDDNEEVYVVDSATICQYTGLTDKNGNKIWENDVVRIKYDDDFLEVGWIKYSNCGVRYNFVVGVEIYSFDESCDIEVIGNIFDNPELLKGEDMTDEAKFWLDSDEGIKPYLRMKNNGMPQNKINQIAWLLLNGSGCGFCKVCRDEPCKIKDGEKCTTNIANYIRKIVLDEAEKEIRNQAITEFVAEAMKRFAELDIKDDYASVTGCKIILREIAEEMRCAE